jgi:hypothetical protein
MSRAVRREAVAAAAAAAVADANGAMTMMAVTMMWLPTTLLLPCICVVRACRLGHSWTPAHLENRFCSTSKM